MNEVEKLKILVVDDSDFFGEAFKRIVNDFDCEILFCNEGLTGIKYAIEENPALIIMQIMMPKFDGIDMLKVLDKLGITKKIPVIVMYHDIHERFLPEAQKYNIAKTLYKPFTRKQIIDTIFELIGSKIVLKIKNESKIISANHKIHNSGAEKSTLKTIAVKVFIKSIPEVKRDILVDFTSKNKGELIKVMKNLDVKGMEIGYPKLSYVSEFLIKKITRAETEENWDEVEEYIHVLINLLNLITSERS